MDSTSLTVMPPTRENVLLITTANSNKPAPSNSNKQSNDAKSSCADKPSNVASKTALPQKNARIRPPTQEPTRLIATAFRQITPANSNKTAQSNNARQSNAAKQNNNAGLSSTAKPRNVAIKTALLQKIGAMIPPNEPNYDHAKIHA